MNKISTFHIGPQKSATTWLYRCFEEHPEIACGETDALNYFDIFHHKNEEWLHNKFKNLKDCPESIDMTPSYIRSIEVPERIKSYNPDAKIILCIREPIERAFSHYWHSKKKSEIDLPFEKLFRNYDIFNSWIETGYYANHIERYLQHFDRNQIYVQNFEELKLNPREFLAKTLDFIGVSKDFTPSVLEKRVNIAKPQKTKAHISRQRIYHKFRIEKLMSSARNQLEDVGLVPSLKQETLADVDRKFIQDLLELYEPHTKKLESMLDVDLTSWRSL